MNDTRWTDVNIKQVVEGDRLQVDHGFTCVPALSVVVIRFDGPEAYRCKDRACGLYFSCSDGRHYLTGQLDDHGDFLVGMRRVT